MFCPHGSLCILCFLSWNPQERLWHASNPVQMLRNLSTRSSCALFKDYAHGDNVCNLKKQLFGALVIFANCFHSTISKHLVPTVTGMWNTNCWDSVTKCSLTHQRSVSYTTCTDSRCLKLIHAISLCRIYYYLDINLKQIHKCFNGIQKCTLNLYMHNHKTNLLNSLVKDSKMNLLTCLYLLEADTSIIFLLFFFLDICV